MGVDPGWLDRFAAAGMVPVGEPVPPRTDPGRMRPDGVGYAARRKTMVPGRLTEEAFTEQVIDFAQLHSWRTAHFRAARTANGWRTAVSGDGKGFVDLVLVRDRVVWAELKVGKGKLSAEQTAWSDVLKLAGCEVYLWRESSWPEIERVLGP